ncbi:MAG TPA: cupin domain-containing protein [Clostridia bacterium]|nr:cupin domain-containing protein [Clostridia bacterium]
MAIKVITRDNFAKIPYIKGKFAKALVWPGMGSKFTTVNYFEMEPGDENVPHVHWQSEDSFYILSGEAYVVDLDTGEEQHIYPGCQVFVEPGTWHTVRVVGNSTYSSIGGPCPPDPEMFQKAGLMNQVDFGVYYAAHRMLSTSYSVKDQYDYKAAVPAAKVLEAAGKFADLAEYPGIFQRIVSEKETGAKLSAELGWEAPTYLAFYAFRVLDLLDAFSLGRLTSFLEIGAKTLRLVPRIEITKPAAQSKLAATLKLPPGARVMAVAGLGYVDDQPPEGQR